MLSSETRFWHKLSKQVVRDQNPEEFEAIANEINRILEENDICLKSRKFERTSGQRGLSLLTDGTMIGATEKAHISLPLDSENVQLEETHARNTGTSPSRLDDTWLRLLTTNHPPAHAIRFPLDRTVHPVRSRASGKKVRLKDRILKA
jgi:hypothetical protein